MEPTSLPLEEEEARQQQGSSTGSGSSSGTGYYGHKNGEWRGERRMLDITRDKPVKVCVRVVVPVRDHPKVLTALLFYASGSYQRPIGRAQHLSQKMCSVYIQEVTQALIHPNMLNKYITFPKTLAARQAVSQKFCTKYGLPGVIGCIDGSHFHIFVPKAEEEHLYFSRKHYHSLNVQMFNFVGKLLGPKGNSLKRLQEDTMCKMAVLGRGSMKDRQKEEELRVSGDPKFAHLSDELHVEISAFATPAEAHARIAYALAELRRFLVPDYNDDIRQEQMLEMQILSSQNDQRRLTPPDSSRSGSEETLPQRDIAHKHRLPGVQQSPAPAAIPSGMINGGARDFSPPAPTQPQDHLTAAHHQLAAGHTGHGMLVGGGVLQQPQAHHLLTQNSILGGGDILGLSSPVLGGVLHAHPALRGVKPAAVHALATQGAGGGGAGGVSARKRPLIGARAAMSPTKRAVMTLLARARAATHKHAPAWPAPHEHPALLPLIRDEFVTGVGLNINLA